MHVGMWGDQRQLLLPVDDNYFCRSVPGVMAPHLPPA